MNCTPKVRHKTFGVQFIIMTTDYKITELFCVIDEFCKHFDARNLLEDNSMASFKDVMVTCSNIFQP